MSATPDERTFGRNRNHEAEAYHHPAEQDRSCQRGAGQGATRADREVCAGNCGGGGSNNSDIGTVEVQHRGMTL